MKTRNVLLLFSFALWLFACGTAKRGAPTFAPIPTSAPAVASGEITYKMHCQKCHPGGEAGLAPAINNKPAPGFAIRYQIRHGLGAMPAFKEQVISDEELDHLIAYIKAMRKAKQKASS